MNVTFKPVGKTVSFSVGGMTVTAEEPNISADGTSTASVETQKILAKGEKGDDGITPTVSVTSITGGHNVAFDYGTGDARNTDFDVMDGEVSQADLDAVAATKAPVIIDHAEGDIASFTDGAEDMPFKSCVVDIEPIQSGSGDPSPDNVRPITGWTGCNITQTGKNLFPNKTFRRGTQYVYLGQDVNQSNFPIFLKVGTYTISCNNTVSANLYCKKQNQSGTTQITSSSRKNQSGTVTLSADGYYQFWLYRSSGITAADVTQFQLELDSTATSYEPYTGSSLTLPFGQTVYGGNASYNGDGTWTVKSRPYYASYNGETLVGPWISSIDKYVAGTSPTIGAQVVDMGGTETTFTITTAELFDALKGRNVMWTDTGSISLDYPCDTKLFIEKLTMPTEDDMVANSAIASGSYFMIGNSLFLALANIASGAAITLGTNAQRVSLAEALNTINS